jgi:hypothetical protein
VAKKNGMRKINKKFAGIITGVIILLAAIYSGSYYLTGIHPETSLERYVRTDYTMDYQEFSMFCAYDAKGLFAEIYKETGYSAREIKKLINERSGRAIASLKEVYGVDYKITVKVITAKPFDEEMLANSIAGIESTFAYLEYDIEKIIDTGKITAMTEYEYEVTIAGSKGVSTYQGAMLMAKAGGRWGALPNMF